MDVSNVSINYIAVILAAVAYMVIGAIWYSPKLFGSSWAALLGKKIDDMGDGKAGYIISTAGTLVAAYILAHIIDFVGVTTAAEGLVAGFWVWLGFVATTMATNYSFQGSPYKLFKIDAGYHLLGFAAMGLIIGLFQ